MGLKTVEDHHFDRDGYLNDVQLWTPKMAEKIAARESVELTNQHWEIILLARKYYEESDSPPAMRALVKYLRHHLGSTAGNSIYLLKLFPETPVKIVCKISGLSKPSFCL